MLAIALVPLMAGVGVAIDYTRANATKTAFQAALDSTALMLSKTAATESGADLQNMATNYFKALFTQTNATDIVISAAYSSISGSKVTLQGTANVKTDLLSILGPQYGELPISATSTTTWGNSRLRVALVLDNTGSMAQSGKIAALKTASQNLLTQLQNAAVKPEDVYVSVVPFSKDVNAGTSNVGASWLRWDLWEAANGSCNNSNYTSQSSCVSHNKTWTHANHNTWNGCITDRDQNFDTTNDAPVAGSTLYPAEQYSSCPTQLMGLSNDWTALANKITAMQPNGNTNQAIGLQMGWQSLTAAPFTIPPKDTNYTYKEVIILLTDGLNTEDRWYTNASSIDTRQQKTCDNIKSAGTTIYTVQVNTGNDPTSTLLQNCASNTPGTTDHFFLLTSSTQIITTFGQIGTALSNLRIAQ